MSQVNNPGNGDRKNPTSDMRTVLIEILSYSLGDTIACVPYVSEYQKKHGVNVVFKINKNFKFLLENSYPNLSFVGKDEESFYDEIIKLEYLFFKGIQEGYAEQLGFESPAYIRPVINVKPLQRPIKNKYAVLGIHSTAQLKYWNHPDGIKSQVNSPYWNDLCGMIRKYGYTPLTIEKSELFGNPPYLNSLPSKANNKLNVSLEDSVNYLQHADFFIGLSSGLSWLAHALGKKVAMISNFTEESHEFGPSSDYIRIINKSVCHGCWNRVNVEYPFDSGDWYWCPRHKGTERQFECHTSITPQMVIDQIQSFL
jgi:autotransporter strand-loop-strand O-heptosyltransferase